MIYCADARSTITADVKRVCEDGVLVAAKALQVVPRPPGRALQPGSPAVKACC